MDKVQFRTPGMARACRDAEAIWSGACNPVAVSRALVAAIDAARAEQAEEYKATGSGGDGSLKSAPAFAPARLICAQLAYILGVEPAGIFEGYDTFRDADICRAAMGETAGVE